MNRRPAFHSPEATESAGPGGEKILHTGEILTGFIEMRIERERCAVMSRGFLEAAGF